MASVSSRWQTVGNTFGQELRQVEHIKPQQAELLFQNHQSSNSGESRVGSEGHSSGPASGSGDRIVVPRSTPPRVPQSQLSRTQSDARTTIKLRGSNLAASSEMGQFLNRLTFSSRARGYPFSRALLQRQPSTVITPDRSSYNYMYRNRDLVKRRPRPRGMRISRPVTMWKNPKPMDVLANNGQVDLPPFMLDGTQDIPSLLHTSYEHHTNSNSDPNSSSSRGNQQSNVTGGVSNVATTTQLSDSSRSGARDHPHQVKINLPVKQSHELSNKDGGHNKDQARNNELEDTSERSTDFDPPATSDEGVRVPSSSILRKNWSEGPPHTPTLPISTSGDELDDVVEIRNLDEDSAPLNTVSETNKRGKRTPPPLRPQAQTLEHSSFPASPTSLPSSYRPESWRRSAIISRNRMSIVEPSELDFDNEEELADAWSSYLKKAIAQRVVGNRERRAVELENEIRWSNNNRWSTDDSTDVSDDANTDASSTSEGARSSGESLMSVSVSSVRQYMPNPEASGSHIMDSPKLYAASAGSTSRLAPRYSPRAMAAASREQIHLLQHDQQSYRQGGPSGSSTSIGPGRRSVDSVIPDNNDEARKNAKRFSNTITAAPMRYVALFADSRGDGLQSPWQPDDHTSTKSHEFSSSNTHTPSIPSDVQRITSIATSSAPNLRPDDEDIAYFDTTDEGTNLEVPHSESIGHEPVEPEFDFGERTSSRKRPLVSPSVVSSPIVPRDSLAGVASPLTTPVMSSVKIPSSESLESLALLKTEPAPTIVRSQSRWKKQREPSLSKRVKSSASKEHLLHARQKTMESMWGAEDSDDSI